MDNGSYNILPIGFQCENWGKKSGCGSKDGHKWCGELGKENRMSGWTYDGVLGYETRADFGCIFFGQSKKRGMFYTSIEDFYRDNPKIKIA